MGDRAPLAVEALARLSHPLRGMLQPSDFVPQIESAGHACQLTYAILWRALADLRSLGPVPPGHRPLDMAVNVPLDVLLVPDHLAHLNWVRDKAGLTSDRIVIELTESRPIADVKGLGITVGRAREAGYQVAIDDFSPSMAHGAELLDLPFSSVKFDHMMIAAAAQPGPHATFVERTTAAAQARGMTVIAEGVETEAAWLRMRALGIDAVQGFWISRPIPPKEITSWQAVWTGGRA